MVESTPPMEADVTVVILTYGRRGHHVARVVQALNDSGSRPKSIIVVDNGSFDPIEPSSEPGRIPLRRVDMGGNLGSAGGYRAGLKEASGTAGLIWLLDDDNCPTPNCLARLVERRQDLGENSIAVAFRPERSEFQEIVRRGGSRPIRRNGFMAFHWRGTPGGSASDVPARNGCLPLAYFGYGGALLPSAVVQKGILPNQEMFVYHDDSDWSYRLAKAGFRAWLVPDAIVADLEVPYGGQPVSKVSPLFSHHMDFRRAWFAIRNRAWVERHLGFGGWEWFLNAALWVVLQGLRSVLFERRPLQAWARARLAWRAFRAGADLELTLPPETDR